MKNRLLDFLRSLSPKNIKLLTSEVILQRGYEYFFQRKLVSLTWYDSGRLICIVRGTKTYLVTISCDDESFFVVCTCPSWNDEELCKHAICALLTLSNLLHDKNLQKTPNNLLSILLDGNATHSVETNTDTKIVDANQPITIKLTPFEYVFHFIRPYFRVGIFRGAKNLSAQDLGVGSSLARLVNQGVTHSDLSIPLREALNDSRNTNVVIEVETKNTSLIVTWDRKNEFYPLTEINLKEDGYAYVRGMIRQKNNVVLNDIIRISETMVVDVEGNRLFIVDSKQPWSWLERLFKSINRSAGHALSGVHDVLSEQQAIAKPDKVPFQVISNPIPFVPLDMNINVPLFFKHAERGVIDGLFRFKKNDVVVIPKKIEPRFIINGSIDTKTNTIRLEPFYFIDGQCETLFFYVLMTYVNALDKSLASWLRTKTRRIMVLKALLGVINTDNSKKASTFIKQAIDEIKKTYHGNMGNSGLKGYFENFCTRLFDDSASTIIAVHKNFYEVSVDFKKLWSVCGLLVEFFNESVVDENAKTPCFVVSLELFYQKFYSLSTLLEQRGIEFRFNNKRVETVQLKVKVDASARSSGSGWFDIAPHIEAEGIVLSDEQREVLFSNNGTIESADCIRILDPKSREIVELLATIFQRGDEVTQFKKEKHITHLPRLRVLDLIELRRSGATVVLAEDDEDLVNRLTNFSKIEKIPLPKHFLGELREYQKSGYQWLAFLYKNEFGACLADDMGLGKTIQVIAFLGGLHEGIIASRDGIMAPHLIVVPPTLVFNWQQELNKFYPELKVRAYTGKSADKNFADYDVILTTYDRVRLDIEYLKQIKFHLLILDEAQAIKNIYAARTCAVRQLKSHFTVCLTGTPLENHIGEYHSIIDVALPGLLPEYKKFLKYIQESTNNTLIQKTKPFVLRRTKDAILKELPSKVESNIILMMSDKQQKVYATTVAEVKRMIDQAYETKSAAQAKVIALTAILRLRQICISPEIIDDKSACDSPKVDHLMSNLGEIVQEGSSALVFSQFTKCLDLLEKALVKEKIAFYRIDGKTSMPQRKKIVESFQKDDCDVSVLLLSLKTGGVGLNLTRANYVFHIDPWWNPSVENQASDRSHRIGQQKTVFVSRLIMHGTIEEKMMALKEKKMKLFNEVIEQASNTTKDLISKKDFDLLLS